MSDLIQNQLETSTGDSYLLRLPQELIIEIFRHVRPSHTPSHSTEMWRSQIRTLRSLTIVSKSIWAAAVVVLYEKINLSLGQPRGLAESLRLLNCTLISHRIFSPMVKSISLVASSHTHPDMLRDFLRHLTHLRELTVWTWNTSDRFLPDWLLEVTPSLLELHSGYEPVPELVVRFSERVPGLRVFCAPSGYSTWPSHPGTFPQLTTLALEYSSFTFYTQCTLNALQHMSLKISDHRLLEGVARLPRLPQLISLRVEIPVFDVRSLCSALNFLASVTKQNKGISFLWVDAANYIQYAVGGPVSLFT